jgi:hypothetical protein
MQPAARPRSRSRRLFHAAGIVLAIAVAYGAFLIWRFDQPPFDLAKLEQLTPGMTQDQVRGILGAPSRQRADSWSYSAFLAWPLVEISFDASGHYVRYRHDR